MYSLAQNNFNSYLKHSRLYFPLRKKIEVDKKCTSHITTQLNQETAT